MNNNFKIRKYTKTDFPAVIKLFGDQPFVYNFPDESEFVDIQLVVDDKDELQMVLGSRKVIEYYLLVNPQTEMNPFLKWNYIQELIKLSWIKLAKAGYKQVFCFLPPEIFQSFGKRLLKIGAKIYEWPVLGGNIPKGDK